MQRSNLDASAIAYIEAHGTGTSLGDPIELQALAAVLGPGHTPDRPLRIGSAKTNIGHLEAAAGVAGLIKVVLSMQHEQIAPQLHFQTPNPHVAWDRMPLAVVTKPEPWPRGPEPRRAGVSSFGFSGTNAHVIVEEPPPSRARTATHDRPHHVLTMSARSEAALQELAARYESHLSESPDLLGDVCFTANTGRSALPERAAIAGGSTADVREALRALRDGVSSARTLRGRAAASPSGVVFMFTGEGAQYAGMARTLYHTQPIFRDALDACDAALRSRMERPLLDVLYRTEEPLVDTTAYTQPALFAIEYALTELWRSWGVTPTAVIGHSVGEFAAACAAGVLTLTDALTLVAARARLMQQLPAGGAMASVLAEESRLLPLLDRGGVAIAAVNAPDSTVISGSQQAVDDVLSRAAALGLEHQRLTVSHAFHSPLVDPMLDAFEAAASAVTHAPARIPYASNLTGGIVDAGFTFDGRYWRRHAREAVRFAQGISALYAQGHRTFLEVGPSATLLALGQRCVPASDATWFASLRRGRDDWEQLGGVLAGLYVQGVPVDWAGFDRPYDRRLVALPTYPFQRERFWIDPPVPRQTLAVAAQPGLRSDRGLLYDVQWEPAGSSARAAGTAKWIALPDRGGIARHVQAEIVRQGGRCDVVDPAGTAGDPFGRDLDGIDGVLDFRMLDVEAAGDLPEALARVSRLFAAAPSGGRRPLVWIVTRGAQLAGGDGSSLSAAHAAAWGLARVAAVEQPEMWGGLIDLDPRAEDGGVAPMAAGLLAFDGEDQVAYRGGRRFVARLRPSSVPAASPLALSPDGTYLITGGTGALGVQLAQRFLQRGAGRVVLMSRSGERPAPLATIANGGAAIVVARGDVSNREDLARVVADIRKTASPLRGIVHAAGIVRSVPVGDLSANEIDEILRAKTIGTELLLDAVRDLPLDFVAFFSSVSSIWGSKGLAAYAAGNAFLDAAAHRCRAAGVPALSVNWGPWADGGMTTEESREWLAQLGLDALDPADALDHLEGLIGSGVTQATVARVDWARFIAVYTAKARRPLLEGLGSARVDQAPAAGPSAAGDLLALAESERIAALEARVLNATAAVLRCAPAELDPDAPLNQLGLDSLVGVELRNRLQRDTGVLLPVVSILDGASVRALAALALEQLGRADRPVTVGAAQVDAHEAQALLGRLSELDDAEVERLLASLAADARPF